MEYNNTPEVRLPNGTKIRSKEDGEIYTIHDSTETNNQFGYGVYRYRVNERLDTGFALYWKWFDVIGDSKANEIREEILESLQMAEHGIAMKRVDSLITTIESLQESFDKQVKGHQYTAKKLANEKVITALAIKALEPYAKKPNRDGGEKARLALAEIKRLSHEQT